MKIHFVSDVVCPWCAIGFNSLERALERLGDTVPVDLHIEPFELNPQLPAEGQDLTEHLAQKYGATPEQLRRNHDAIAQRGASVGFAFDMERRTRIWNTFAAHRLLHWAGLQDRGAQRVLSHKLFEAYFTQGENPGDPAVLQRLAAEAGLDAARAHEVIVSDAYAEEVRDREGRWTGAGINAVPAAVVANQYLIQGGQPPEAYEQALREIYAKLVEQQSAAAS